MQAALDADRLQRELEAIFGPRRVSLRPVDHVEAGLSEKSRTSTMGQR